MNVIEVGKATRNIQNSIWFDQSNPKENRNPDNPWYLVTILGTEYSLSNSSRLWASTSVCLRFLSTNKQSIIDMLLRRIQFLHTFITYLEAAKNWVRSRVRAPFLRTFTFLVICQDSKDWCV